MPMHDAASIDCARRKFLGCMFGKKRTISWIHVPQINRHFAASSPTNGAAVVHFQSLAMSRMMKHPQLQHLAESELRRSSWGIEPIVKLPMQRDDLINGAEEPC